MPNEPYMVAAKATIDQIHPLKDILLVRRLPDDEVTASGLYIPAVARDARMGTRIGEVLRVGDGDLVTANPVTNGHCRACDAWDCQHVEWDTEETFRSPMECKVGDRIVYMRCPDNDVCIDGVDCVLLREEQHVLAILEEV
jgi:co-chaperonin GroES (HSP10)